MTVVITTSSTSEFPQFNYLLTKDMFPFVPIQPESIVHQLHCLSPSFTIKGGRERNKLNFSMVLQTSIMSLF